jgi:Ran GTPase-activating protein (RanGAP) involved in mRNA processing and transport
MKCGLRQRVFFMVAFLSVTIVYAQVDASGPDEFETLFKDNLQRGALNLSGKKIGDKGLTVLLRQEFLKDLEKMDLRYNEISPAGAKMLANTSAFKKLKTLILKHNFFSDEGAIALAESKSFPLLENLQLGWNEVRDAGALALAGSQNFPELKKLDLRGNFLASQTKDVLRSSFSHLRSLRIFQSE